MSDSDGTDSELPPEEIELRRKAADKIPDDPEFESDDFDPESYRLPKGSAFRLSGPQVFRIGMFATMLVAVIFMARPCAEGIANFVDSFSPAPSTDAGVATPPPPDPKKLKRLKDMSDTEFRQTVGAPDGSPVPRPQAPTTTPAPEQPAPN